MKLLGYCSYFQMLSGQEGHFLVIVHGAQQRLLRGLGIQSDEIAAVKLWFN